MHDERYEYRSGRAAGKDFKPKPIGEVLTKAEPGVESGDFRMKLQKSGSQIDTKAAFPTKKAAVEQVDFRNLLKRKTSGPEKKVYRSGGAAQTDFRSSLKRQPPKVGCLTECLTSLCLGPPSPSLFLTVREREGLDFRLTALFGNFCCSALAIMCIVDILPCHDNP